MFKNDTVILPPAVAVTQSPPPTFPLRPVNGGPLPKAQPKRGEYIWEPKVNGWRAWEHTPTGAMFNRKNERLSIEAEFKPICERIKSANLPITWLDTEAFERRHPFGRGSLVLLDFAPDGLSFPKDLPLLKRQQAMVALTQSVAQPWKFLHEPPPENALLYFAYTFTDYGIQPPTEADWLPDEGHYHGEDMDGIHTGWRLMQEVNHKLGAEVFEGLVAKRADSQYPLQLRSPEQEFPFWMKHRWRF